MQDLIYGCSGDRELSALLYTPQQNADDHSGAVIDVHGGAWYRGDNRQGQHYCAELARRGWLVLSPEFRDASLGGQHPAACQDITACVRYLRTHADHFGIEPERISLMGSSSGGHLAMLAAVLANSPEFMGTQVNESPPGASPRFAASAVSAGVNGVAALWPVADPLHRYQYAQATDRPELVAGHEAYFGSEAQMLRASVPRLVSAGEALILPPLLVVQAGNDKNVPPAMLEALVQAWQARSAPVHWGFYPGMPHGFACQAGGLTARCIHDVHSFLQACLVAEQSKPSRQSPMSNSHPTNHKQE